MAQVVLGGLGGVLGGGIGRIVGATLGGMLDRSLIAGLEPARQKGPRLSTLAIQGAAEGAPMACVFGRARVTGQVIWAARFLEGRKTSSAGKGGPGTVEYAYSLSFAVALCEGPIDGIGRVWADGQPMDLTGVTMRLHRDEAVEPPDSLIEAVEGTAPAYRGVAYVVFEDLPLARYGNRPPQLAFEVFRRPRGSQARLEDLLDGVCLIPGAGEFVLATETVLRREGLTRTLPENLHGGDGRTDLAVSLDQLQAQLPNLKRVSLVVGWFGDDLRAGHLTIRPGVERRDKPTGRLQWEVAGLDRAGAHLISQSGGGPAYGGTPSDETVRQAVAELKARGLEVTLYPFLFMDVPAGNGLPDPYGGSEQAAYPWRGRVRAGDAATASDEVAAAFGDASGWGLRRLALHYAALAAETGADGLLIGSEMRGLTWSRDAGGGFPAVAAFRALAAECRAVAGPGVALSYAADWSEYSGFREGADVLFHLDPLWADPAIDYVGIDWYPPLGDWRDGTGGLDSAVFTSPDDPAGLAAQVAGGEGFDWFYASPADRDSQTRSPIADTAHGEDWVFRPKDLKGWWSHPHHDRPAGVRAGTPTAWVPGMKPIRLTEFGCPAVDRGANAPNLFQDPKSAESAAPPFSTGARDDRMQRRALEAILGHFADGENNPVSAVYGERMVEAADVWCWDARPWPAFPGRSDVWADASAWRTGHWLNGRLHGETQDLIAEILKRGGLSETAVEIGQPIGEVHGYVIDRPMRTRDALEPLLAAVGMVAAERNGRISLIGDEPALRNVTSDSLALPDAGECVRAVRALEAAPGEARVRFIDGATDYQTGLAVARPDAGECVRAVRALEAAPGEARVRFIDGATDYQTGLAVARTDGEGGGVDLDLPAVCPRALAQAAAMRALKTDRDGLTVSPGPLEALALEPGDAVSVEGQGGHWRVTRLDRDESPSVVLERITVVGISEDSELPIAGEAAVVLGAPLFRMLDLPPLPGAEDDGRLMAAVASDPWKPMTIFAGPDPASLGARGEVSGPATVGVLVNALATGVRFRWDEINTVDVRVEGRFPESLSTSAVLAGANAIAVETLAGWEIIQFRTAELLAADTWRLSGLLRGQQGTEAATVAGATSGALVVFLGANLERIPSSSAERGLPLIWRIAPFGGPPGGVGAAELVFAAGGLHARPWSPAHLRRTPGASGDVNLTWIARLRLDGDRWDGEPAASDLARFRVRLLDGGAAVRTFTVDEPFASLAAASLAADFPDGLAEAAVAVAQWGDGYGWGAEAGLRLV